jgi:plastocyanin
MARIAILAVSIALAAVLAAGCGSSDDKGSKDSGGKAEPAATAPPAGATTGASQTVQVKIKDIKFIPQNITVKEGQKVRWTNDDNVPHTVTATKNGTFDSGTLKPDAGAFYETTMRNAGKIDYVCQIHPGQTGTITIVP